jgi:hypothetical protein
MLSSKKRLGIPARLWDESGPNKTDVVFIVMRMKSNVGGAEETSQQRAWEARLLVDKLNLVKSFYADKDIVLMGSATILPQKKNSQL